MRTESDSLISRARVSVLSTLYGIARRYSVAWRAFREAQDVEYLQPQGLHFNLPTNAGGVMLAPGGDPSASVLVSASGALPSVGRAGESGGAIAGEGGLHYLGSWRVYLDSSGHVHLGSHDASDWVARSSIADQNFTKLRADITSLITAIKAANTAGAGAGGPGAANFSAATAAFDPLVSTLPQTHSSVASSVTRTD